MKKTPDKSGSKIDAAQAAALRVTRGLPPLAGAMKVDLMINEKNDVWLLHDAPLPNNLKWMEFDADTGRLTLVTTAGEVQDLGMDIPISAQESLSAAVEIYTVQISDQKKVDDCGIVPLITRQKYQ